jgi:CheY-like chemotaxis protein
MPYRRNMHGELRLAGKRILVVEDEPLVAMDLAAILEDAGAQVIGPAASLGEALRLACEDGIDGAILDVNLRGEDVSPTAELLASRSVPIVFHTGHGHPLDLKTRFPGARVCSKPVRPETIVASLESALR